MLSSRITQGIASRGLTSIIRTYATTVATSRPDIQIIKASAAERQAGRLTDRNLETAVRHVLQDGLIVVEDALAHEHLDRLNEKMVRDALHLSGRGENSPFNYNRSNLQQDPPPLGPYFEPSIFLSESVWYVFRTSFVNKKADPIATQITSSILGPKPKLTFMSGNSAMPPSDEIKPQRQPVHSDADFAHPSHPFALVVNVPLITMTPENGSTEVWLGTHQQYGLEAQEGAHGDRASGRILQTLLTARNASSPPVQPVVKKGSFIIRDLRLWHAGMPNHSDKVRVMLAMIHFAPWYRNSMRLELGESVREVLSQPHGLDIRADFVPDGEVEANYLHRAFGNAYDFGQEV